MVDLGTLTRKFLLGEGRSAGLSSYIQNLSEILGQMKPRSRTDQRRMEIARENLREIRRHVRKLEEKINLLEEHIGVLEEDRK
tara:strand:- start:467 stop:715 length:249 start_codon:yes stop_codon:yes gene_type:complete